MSNGRLKILERNGGSRDSDCLKDNVYIGIRYNGITVHLNAIAFEVNNASKNVIIIGSDALAPYMEISGRGDDPLLKELLFSVPYELVVDEEDILSHSTQENDYKTLEEIGIPVPEVFTFCLVAEITDEGFTHSLRWSNDPLDLISKIFGASFTFSKTTLGE